MGPWSGRPGTFVADGGFKFGLGLGLAPGMAAALIVEGRDAIPKGLRVKGRALRGENGSPLIFRPMNAILTRTRLPVVCVPRSVSDRFICSWEADPMAPNALGVANAVLDSTERLGLSVTPMQLQKLLYFVNGWHMEVNDGEPIALEPFQAWDYGPVSPLVYHAFKRHGARPIDERSVDGRSGEPVRADLDEQQTALIDEVMQIYGRLSGAQMVHLTHKPGTPWAETFAGGAGKNERIRDELILKEFRSLRERTEAA